MEPSQRNRMRDRISVDLHGLKAALTQRAQALGVSPSDFVRTALAGALQGQAPPRGGLPRVPISTLSNSLSGASGRVRLCVRMRHEHARAAVFASQRHHLSLGDYLAGLVADVPVLSSGGSRDALIAELRASSAELSTLSRNIHRLTVLLRQADVAPAGPYREMLDTVESDIHRHLALSSRALAELQPRQTSVARPNRSSR